MEENLTMNDNRHHDNSYVSTCTIRGAPIVSLITDGKERLCLAQISNDLLKDFSYNEIHNRRVALGITCVQCTPVQLELLRRAGAMPSSSRRCGMITRREAERLVNSFLESTKPLNLPENFVFEVYHHCAWGCRGLFIPIRYNSSRAKCIRCSFCDSFLSPNKFIFHSHRLPNVSYVQPDSPNFNAWRRHLRLHNPTHSEDLRDAWEDVKAMFNGGNRKRTASATGISSHNSKLSKTNNNNNNNTTDESNEQVNEDNDEDREGDDYDDIDKIEDKKEVEEEEEEEEKIIVPTPPPAKISKTRTKEKKLPTHNVVSSTTADEQLPDMNMFLPPPPPLLSAPPSTNYFPFPPPLSSSNPLSLVTLNSTDWLQFFRSPLFVPSSFRLPISTMPRRFPFDITHQNPSIIGSSSHSAFKPPIPKHD
ncbi:unnamed protein product [Adineta steineri]|uniref:c-SKI SMAD4-binding domain-containing protein n=2 Tax=Adineta steineri TaxID=433720 RepID=A0A814EMB0_9BILA|nr:unnamed protein product [Adineta steineri]CAF0971384.1 unnamed protein product [Adineta steineri]CAF1038690.1 unnamed protein product [Adineta steineri]